MQFKEKWHPDQLTLGELIEVLEYLQEKDTGFKTVYFDFGSVSPTGNFCSYRGIYDHLAVEFNSKYYYGNRIKINDFLSNLKNMDGEEEIAWKGDQVYMDLKTPLWAANSGDSSGTMIVGAISEPEGIVLLTKYLKKIK